MSEEHSEEIVCFVAGSIRVELPRENLKKHWERAKKTIDAYFSVDMEAVSPVA